MEKPRRKEWKLELGLQEKQVWVDYELSWSEAEIINFLLQTPASN